MAVAGHRAIREAARRDSTAAARISVSCRLPGLLNLAFCAELLYVS